MYTILIDFDGTCVSHEFPHIGKDIGAVSVLQELVMNGHRLVLFTMRSNKSDVVSVGDTSIHSISGNYLSHAVEWFRENLIPLYGIQTNPTQSSWTNSPKAYGEFMIDDSAIGCPLKIDHTISNRPFVDWLKVREILVEKGIL